MEDFLRGPQREATFSIFPSLPDARKWAKKNFKHGLPEWRTMDFLDQHNTYSAKAEPGGRGAGAFCVVTKTNEWYYRARAEAIKDELATARGLRRALQ